MHKKENKAHHTSCAHRTLELIKSSCTQPHVSLRYIIQYMIVLKADTFDTVMIAAKLY